MLFVMIFFFNSKTKPNFYLIEIIPEIKRTSIGLEIFELNEIRNITNLGDPDIIDLYINTFDSKFI